MKYKVLIIGPDIDGNGGIASVIKTYTDMENLNRVIDIIPSYVDGYKMHKIVAFIKGYIRCICKLISDKKIKIVHIHSASRASFKRKKYFLKLSKIFNKKVIFHIHGAEFIQFYNQSSDRKKREISNVLKKADKIIALGEMWKKNLYDISENENIEILYNPVVVSEFKQSDLSSEDILFMGRLGRRKGIYDLLDVIPSVIEKYPNVKFNIGGDGEIENVRKIIEKRQIERNVEILGWVDFERKIEYFKKSSIYILPSYDEGLPVSILEAMASGLPTIASNVGAIEEQIDHNKNGYLFNPGDKKQMEKYIVKLLEDKKLRLSMGKIATNRVKEKFDINVIEKKLIKIYEEIK